MRRVQLSGVKFVQSHVYRSFTAWSEEKEEGEEEGVEVEGEEEGVEEQEEGVEVEVEEEDEAVLLPALRWDLWLHIFD